MVLLKKSPAFRIYYSNAARFLQGRIQILFHVKQLSAFYLKRKNEGFPVFHVKHQEAPILRFVFQPRI